MVALKVPRLWRGGYDSGVRGYRGAALPAGTKLVPPKSAGADTPACIGGYSAGSKRVGDFKSPPQTMGAGVPDGFLQGNHYMRELVDRLWIAVDAAKAVYDTSYPNGVRNLEARMAFVRAWERLHGEGTE